MLIDCNLYIINFLWITVKGLSMFIPILVLLKKLFLKNSRPVAIRLLLVTLSLLLLDGIIFKIAMEMIWILERIR